jgi:hypothetical protein
LKGSETSALDWRFLSHRFHEDQLSQLLAQSQSGVAHLTNEIRPAGDQLDDLIFSKPDFPQPIADFRRGAQLLDPDRHARLDAA